MTVFLDILKVAACIACGIGLQWLYVHYCSRKKADYIINFGMVVLLVIFLCILFV